MRILVTGAYGLIGSAVLARLHREGHALIGAGRAIEEARRRLPYARWIVADFGRLTSAPAWQPLLSGIDAVVNCVGVLQDSARDELRVVQLDATCALFDACASIGVRRVIQISAAGVDAAGPTPFSRTKAQADAYLQGLALDWVILRPALVLSPAAYGGTAMLRGLAGFPFVTPVAGPESRVQVVSVDDVADTVALCVRTSAPAKVTWDLAHPRIHTLGEIVSAFRAWHGFAPVRQLAVPRFLAMAVTQGADLAGLFGWRSPARSTALAQLSAGVVGDPSLWIRATSIDPKDLATILAERPAAVQDRWYARLYWLKPVAILALAMFWIATGMVALSSGRAAAINHLVQAGLAPTLATWTVSISSLLDVVLGLALCVRRIARPALLAMLAVSAIYVLVASLIAPQLWLDPLGPYVKIVPALVATVFTLAVIDER
jgi:uncharacterized protein YbjT (DUF2867 family)